MYRTLHHTMKLCIVLALSVAISLQCHEIAVAKEKDRPLPGLTVALLPILDSLPCYVAQEEGYFADAGIDVKAIQVNSGLDRDQLMQAGAADGMMAEMHAAANFNRRIIQVKIVRTARRAYQDFPLFRILAAPGSGITSAGDLAGRPIGISKNNVIEYVTDRLLAARGLAETDIRKKSVPVITERYQLLLQGRLDAAVLPDPLAKSAMESGAALIVDDSEYPRYSISVLGFSMASLREKPDTVRAFLTCWDRAAAALNAEPAKYRALLIKKVRLPANIRDTYAIPPYPRQGVPSRAQWDDVMTWMVGKGLLAAPIAYERSVTTEYLEPAVEAGGQ